jgi:hypothetical protein
MAHAHEVQRVRRSAEEWREILAEWSGSGLSQAAFCRQRGFSSITFSGWKRHFRVAAAAPTWPRGLAVGGVTAPQVPRPTGPMRPRPRFIELAAEPRPSEPAVYEVRLANGRVVRVGPEFDPATLRRLLATVESNGGVAAGAGPAGGAAGGRGC